MKKLQILILACMNMAVTCAANVGVDGYKNVSENIGVYIKNNTTTRLVYEVQKSTGDKIQWQKEAYGATLAQGLMNLVPSMEKQLPYSFNSDYALHKGLSEESIGVKIYAPNSLKEFIIVKATMDYSRVVISYCFSTKLNDCKARRSESGVEEYIFDGNFKVSVQREGLDVLITIDPIETKATKKPGWWGSKK